jgi:hypothetical protein
MKLSLCSLKHHVTNIYLGVGVLLTSALDKGGWLGSCLGRYTPVERKTLPI